MILFTCAVAEELAWFVPRPDVDILVTGVGPVEAAGRVAQSLTARKYDLVVSAGIAGAFPGAASIGDGVVVAEEFFELAIESGDPIILPRGAVTNERSRAHYGSYKHLRLSGFRSVRGITVSRVTASEATAKRLRALGAEVETMEGFAVLRAAEMADIPVVEIRGISNYVGDRAKSEWDFSAGIVGLQRITAALLAEIDSNE